MACAHSNVAVDYDHPYQLLAGVPVAEMKAMPSEGAREVMPLSNPRCLDCGQELGRDDIRHRIEVGGDLYDSRFQWVIGR